LKTKKQFRCIVFLLLFVFLIVNSVSGQTQRRFFIKKSKPYAFNVFIGSVRGMGFSGRIRVFKKVHAEAMIGVGSFIQSRYLTPYPGNVISFSLRLRANLNKRLYLAGGFYEGLFDFTEKSDIISAQVLKWVSGGTFSLGLKKFFTKRIGLEIGGVLGLPESSSDIVNENSCSIYLVTVHREPKELSFSPLITVNINL